MLHRRSRDSTVLARPARRKRKSGERKLSFGGEEESEERKLTTRFSCTSTGGSFRFGGSRD